MAPEIVLQLAALVLTLAMFFTIHRLIKQGSQTKLRSKNRATHQFNRHLVQGSHVLARARSNPHRARSLAYAKNALIEADEALSLSPKDPAAHILKASALELMGHQTAALKSLDSALLSPMVKSLSERQREEALVKRAQLKLAVNRRRRVDSAIEDLVQATSLSDGTNSKAMCLLGQCFEWKGMTEKAKEAFERALGLEPESVEAREGLGRLGPLT
ncbi:Tetratricopeptide repeat-containing domain [Quillaja saponaria]|uniref:Tetratricopeptide repeat-containing domain n=1 Tax=Quillaja saponaria TaxID=32244 RepID=A0AAD7L953_QUISA|nr:Tetratricopeptide repeat-containing domain [Quillaja saponaria]